MAFMEVQALLRTVILSIFILLLPITLFSEEVNLEAIINGAKETPAFKRAEKTTKIGNEILDKDLGRMEEKLRHVPAIEKKIVQDKMRSFSSDEKNPENTGSPIFRPEERIFVFVSETVPSEMLRSYAEALKAIGKDSARLVFRGIPGKELLSRLGSAKDICQEKSEQGSLRIVISEKLFKSYGINAVPAIIYDPTAKDPGKDFSLIYGAGEVEEAFRLFQSRTGNEAFSVAISRFKEN
jgi:hypothetical protein